MAETTSRGIAPTRRKPANNVMEKEQPSEKDETELRLEKILFGDDAGFLDSLRTQEQATEGALVRRHNSDEDEDGDAMSIDGDKAEPEQDWDEIPDQDLFFLDAGTASLPEGVRRDLETSTEEEDTHRRQPVWHDSDDDRITVSLANNTRLRKLRDTEDEDVVTGREYIARLRRQYERLHPTPEWLTYARKKRRTSPDSDADSDVDMSDTESSRSVQPLSSLLRNAGTLTKSSSTNNTQGKRRKLRPEVIDISKLPPVCTSGPSSIDSLQFHPYYPLLLTSGPSSTASLYHISPHPPNPNPLLTSLHLKNTPLHNTAFCTSLPTTSSPSNPTSTSPDTTRIILSSRRRYFHIWSLTTGLITKVSRPLSLIKHLQKTTERFKISPSGKYIGLISSSRAGGGAINVLDSHTISWVCSCRIDSLGGVADFDWWGQYKPLTSSNPSKTPKSTETEEIDTGFSVIGKSGEVSEYHIPSRRIISRWHDDGAVGSTVMSISRDNRWIAIGSSSGIVNIYDRYAASFKTILNPNLTISASAAAAAPTAPSSTTESITEPHRPNPTRTISSLTTPISHLIFSADSQLLIASSRWKKNALKLIHLPSCTVYKNWPTDKTGLGRVSSVAINNSEDGGRWVLAVGNEAGAVRLWEIRE